MLKNHVRRIRRNCGLSQTKLANLAGLAESTLSDIELGKRLARPKARRSLADALIALNQSCFRVYLTRRTSMDADKLVYTPREVGKLLGLSKNLVYAEIAVGHIPAIRLSDRKIIIPKIQLDAWLAGKLQ